MFLGFLKQLSFSGSHAWHACSFSMVSGNFGINKMFFFYVFKNKKIPVLESSEIEFHQYWKISFRYEKCTFKEASKSN